MHVHAEVILGHHLHLEAPFFYVLALQCLCMCNLMYEVCGTKMAQLDGNSSDYSSDGSIYSYEEAVDMWPDAIIKMTTSGSYRPAWPLEVGIELFQPRDGQLTSADIMKKWVEQQQLQQQQQQQQQHQIHPTLQIGSSPGGHSLMVYDELIQAIVAYGQSAES